MSIEIQFNDGLTLNLVADKIIDNEKEIILYESGNRFYTVLIKSKIHKYIIGGCYEKTYND